MKINITKEDRQALNKVFENFGRKKTEEEIFYDLCFAIMAPQTKFANNIKVIQRLKELDFYYFGEAYEGYCGITQIEEILKPVRFYKNKTKYLLEAKKKFPEILQAISSLDTWDNKQSIHVVDIYKIREWLVDNVKGLGYKASSHFLRNMGDTELSILDTHIVKFLNENIGREGLCGVIHQGDWGKIIKTRKGYLLAERVFQKIAGENNMVSAYLDAYLWKSYSGTSWNDFKY
jgi:N-glycosylase/DNA lyase